MKFKILIAVLGLLLFASTGFSSDLPTITDISPAVNTTETIGNVYNISYTVSDDDAIELMVNLYYSTTTSVDYANYIAFAHHTASGTYSVDWDTTGVSPGTYYVTAMVVDSPNSNFATNHSAGTITLEVAPDTTPPPAPTLVGPADGSSTLDTTPTFTWNSVSDESGIQYYEIDIDGNTYQETGTTYTPPGDLSFGTHNWKVRAVDGADNVGNWSVQWSITIEEPPVNQPPTITDISPDTDITIEAGTIYQIDYTINDPDGDAMSVSLYYGPNSDCSFDCHHIFGTDHTQNGQYSYMWDTTDVAPGTYYISSYVLSLHPEYTNHIGDGHSAGRITIVAVPDTTPPPAPTLAGPADGSTTTEKRPEFTWNSVSDESGIQYYIIEIDGNIEQTTDLSFTPNTDLSIGLHTWRVRAVDGADNIGDWSQTWSVTVEEPAQDDFIMNPEVIDKSDGTIMNITYTTTDPGASVVFKVTPVSHTRVLATISASGGTASWDGKKPNGKYLKSGYYNMTMYANGVLVKTKVCGIQN